jgi:oxygen-independent coproporphyrinogen-3 oxidase
MLVYIHIPFCDSKCYYCAFNSYVDKFELKADYMQALATQLAFELKRFQVTRNSIETLFIGGGTPSTVAPHLYEKIFALLKPYLQKDAEITTEANPNSATRNWLEGMQKLGVNRVSFGVQSFHTQKLKLLNRAHTPQMAKDAIRNASELGFEHLSLDLIYGVASDTQPLLEEDLKEAFALPIDHLSAYALTIESNTPFEKKPQMAQEQLQTTKKLFDMIENHGFMQYEISNFGRYKSRHNLGYWQYKNYIGAGAGAVGKHNTQRLYPQTDIEKYIANPLEVTHEQLTYEDIRIEKIFLGFRSCVGVGLEDLSEGEKIRASILVEEKKLHFHKGRFYNPEYLLADELALFLSLE